MIVKVAGSTIGVGIGSEMGTGKAIVRVRLSGLIIVRVKARIMVIVKVVQ